MGLCVHLVGPNCLGWPKMWMSVGGDPLWKVAMLGLLMNSTFRWRLADDDEDSEGIEEHGGNLL
jgi:hypothetical protein